LGVADAFDVDQQMIKPAEIACNPMTSVFGARRIHFDENCRI
jgi:hypothetical protein